MPAQPTYGATAKLLHWLIVALLTAQYVIGWLMPDLGRGMQPGLAMDLHISIGLVAFVLIVARFLWRLTHPVAPEPGLPPWQRMSSEAVHWGLYALVLVTTLTGWVYASMRGWAISFFWIVNVPPLVAQGSPLGRAIGQTHQVLIWVLLAAIVIHVAAALYHLLILRDGVMARMLPGGSPEN